MGWDTIIRPDSSLTGLQIREIWHHRDLVRMFVHRNITSQYKQTVLGPLWYVLQPLMTLAIYMVVFGKIAGIPTDGVPQPLFYLSGMCIWQFFSDCLNRTSNTFLNNAGIFSKVYFPRMIVPLANCISNMLRFAIQLLLFIAVYLFYGVHTINPYVLLFPLLIPMIMFMALGFGAFVTSLTTKYRDLQILFSFIVQLWMYATPIVYPLSMVKGKSVLGMDLHTIMCLNPVTPVLDTFKYSFLGCGEFIGWGWLLYSLVFTIVILLCGSSVFNRVQRTFLDTV